MKGLQTEKEGTDGGMRERLQGWEWTGRRVVVVGGVCVCVCWLGSLLWSPFMPCWINGILSLSLSFSPLFFHNFSFLHRLSLPLNHLVILSLLLSLLWFLSLSLPAFLLSCLSWAYVCDVIQDKEAKLAWNVRLTGRESVKTVRVEGKRRDREQMRRSQKEREIWR